MKRILGIAVFIIALFPASLFAQETSPTITIEPENRCSPYNRDHYSYPATIETQIVDRMEGRIYGPYSGRYFDSTGETDIEHIVAVSEAHDSGLCSASFATRTLFARDLDNLTLASPQLNRRQKIAKDVAEWLPAHNQCWYVGKVIAVKKKYGLSMDANEAAAALNVLAGCSSLLMEFTSAPLATATPTATAILITPQFTVARDTVNVRSGPGTNYEIIGTVKRGQAYYFDGRNAGSDWIRFRFGNGDGWVYAPLMTVTDINSVPIVQPSAPPTATPQRQRVAPTIAPTRIAPTAQPTATQPPPPPPTATVAPAPAATPILKDAQYYKDLCGVGARGWVTITLAKKCGFTMPVCRSENPGLYEAMQDRNNDGCVGE